MVRIKLEPVCGQILLNGSVLHRCVSICIRLQIILINLRITEKPEIISGFSIIYIISSPGDVLLSHTRSRAVPSAMKGLTSVFGMGTGVAPSL